MTRLLSILPLAACLTAACPTLALAEDPAEKCRAEAIEDEVAREDMEDYIAECLAIAQSEVVGEEALDEGVGEPALEAASGSGQPAEQPQPK